MRNLYILLFLISCVKPPIAPLAFTFDGKRQVFEKIEAITFLNCGTREWQVSVLDGERFFKINWNANGESWFWYTYHGHSVAYTSDRFAVRMESRGVKMRATFAGGIVRDGIIQSEFTER